MRKSRLPLPTDSELLILQALWDLGPSTVREVHEEILKGKKVVYTTILKLLQIMTVKDLVKRDAKRRPHIFAPKLSEDDTQRLMLDNLIGKAFRGRTHGSLFEPEAPEVNLSEDLEEIRRLVDKIEVRSEV